MTDTNGEDDKHFFDDRDVLYVRLDDVNFSVGSETDLKISQSDVIVTQLAQRELWKLRVRQEMLKKALEREQKQSRLSPPATAAFLLAFIAPKNSAQAFLGDLEEIFQKNAERFGEPQARRMYWFEVARSFGPLVWQWIKRMGFVTLVVDYVRSKIGL